MTASDDGLSALHRTITARGTLGGVAAGSGIAAAIGTSTLLAGGNAFDAALAAALAETVALPPKCGLAGDLVALYVTADSTEPTTVVSIGSAASGLYSAAERIGWRVPSTGGLSVGVPGAPAGYAALAQRGVLPLADVAAPAIGLAERGIVWTPVLARLAAEADRHLVEHQPCGSVFRPVSGPRATGERVPLPGLATLLRTFVDRGPDLFTGDLATTVAEYVRSHGGVLTAEDLRAVEPRVGCAPRVQVDGKPLWATPTPTYGESLQQALQLHAGGSPLTRAVGDALTRLRGGQPAELTGGTSAVAAADNEGNAVVVVHSNSFPQFGSGLVVPGLDLVLSNRAGRGFTFVPDHPNSPVPGRRPLTTMHAWARADSDAWLLGATPGGEQQVPWNAQLLANIAGGDSAEQALTRPRWQFDAEGKIVSEGKQLQMLGARSSHVMVSNANGMVEVTADPRLDGRAVAV